MANTAKELDLTPMYWVQEKHAIELRNRKAEEYSASVKRNRKGIKGIKEEIGYFISGLSVVAMIIAMYFIMILV